MRVYVLTLLTLLSACGPKADQKIEFTCMTPFGVSQFVAPSEELVIAEDSIILYKENQIYKIPRALCVEAYSK